MTPPSLLIPSLPTAAPRAILRAVAAALLIVGGALTIGALWLPWRHYVPPESTTFLSPEDTAPYIPIAEGWAHSFLVFTACALVSGVLAWLTVSRSRSRSAPVLALGSILCACAGVVFASLGIDGAQVWRASEAADIGYYVCLVGYLFIMSAGGVLMATDSKARQP